MKQFTPSSDAVRYAILDDLLSAKPKAKLGKCPHGPPVVEKIERWCGRYNKYRDQYTDMKAYNGERDGTGRRGVGNGTDLWGYTMEQLYNLGFEKSRDAVQWHADEQYKRTGKTTSWKGRGRRENRLDERVWNQLVNARSNGKMPGIYEVTVKWDSYGYIPASCLAEAEQLASTLLVLPLGLDASRTRLRWVAYATTERFTSLTASISNMAEYDRKIATIRKRRDEEIARVEERRTQVSAALAMTMGLLDLEDEDDAA